MDNKEILELYNELGSYSATAKVIGCDPRTVKKRVNEYHKNDSFVVGEANRTGIPFDKISHYWLKTKNEKGDDVSVFVKNKHEIMEYEEIRDSLIRDLENYAPRPPKIQREPIKEYDRHLLVLDPADIHIGKLAKTDETGHTEYNTEVAYERVIEGVMDILAKARLFGVYHIALIIGNDILHVDNSKKTTTGGTLQDTDSQWWNMFETARNLYVDVIELCKKVADVTLIFCPSNHDKVLGFGITDSLYSWYRKDPNVTISNYGKSMRHRKYIRYGNNLIGVTHGDGAKNKDLPSLMQYEAREDWALTKFSYWYVHHFHHKYRLVNTTEIEKDYAGVTVLSNYGAIDPIKNTSVECIRSPSEPDAWHSQFGYVNHTAIEGFLHHPIFGQVARITSFC